MIILWYINWTSSIRLNPYSFLYPLIRKGTVITYVDDIFIQTSTYDQMYETLEEYHKILQKENLKAAPDKNLFHVEESKISWTYN